MFKLTITRDDCSRTKKFRNLHAAIHVADQMAVAGFRVQIISEAGIIWHTA